MKTWKQLLRQPLKTAVGIILMTLAAAIVCLCVGQSLAARYTKAVLDERFSTVGVLLPQENMDGSLHRNSFVLDEELDAWLKKMEATHPQIIRQLAGHGILSAYIPEMTPYHSTIEHQQADIDIQAGDDMVLHEVRYNDFRASPFNMPYCGAMLVIRLDEVYEPKERLETYVCEPDPLKPEDFDHYQEYLQYEDSLDRISVSLGYQALIVGTVTQVVSLDGGYRDPVGRTANLTLYLQTPEQFAALDLVVGETYIVYGMNYMDEHMELTAIFEDLDLVDRQNMDPFNPDLLHVYTQEEFEAHYGLFRGEYAGVPLPDTWFVQLNAISMTLGDPQNLLQFEQIRDASGYLLDVAEKTQYTITDANGNPRIVGVEEYAKYYAKPSIARLEGSVEDFLDGADNATWKTALEQNTINQHAFCVLGVDRLDYLPEFSLQRASIAQGRDFTAEERKNGSSVCLVQEWMAEHNGLQIGDTITLHLYKTDENLPYQAFRSSGKGILNPTASFYFHTMPFVQVEEFTIVGFYRAERWPDVKEDPYGFSANTVIIPKSAAPVPMEKSDGILFNTVILQNGKIEEFHKLATKAGFAGRFTYCDQNYSVIAANFHNYETLGRQMLAVGSVLYLVLLLLFLLLYPGSGKNDVRTMQSFGAGFFRRSFYVTASAMSIVIPGSLLGGWIGIRLWDRMVAALQASADAAIPLAIPPEQLAEVVLVQLLFAMLLTVCTAMLVATSRGIARRR